MANLSETTIHIIKILFYFLVMFITILPLSFHFNSSILIIIPISLILSYFLSILDNSNSNLSKISKKEFGNKKIIS